MGSAYSNLATNMVVRVVGLLDAGLDIVYR
jgi:hypothetical protein